MLLVVHLANNKVTTWRFFNYGGGGDSQFNANGKNGGSGIVVVRYQIAELTGQQKQLVVPLVSMVVKPFIHF